ncbi:MAG TPA: hypothetical protein VF950_04065 [Planctomycetota bacterium]
MSLLLAILLQDTAAEGEVTTAIESTAARGFTYSIKPVATIPDGFPEARSALAGVAVRGKYHCGLARATDGEYEIVKKGGTVAAKSARGWLPLDQYTSPLRQEVVHAFDPEDNRLWNRGNVTAGRKALQELIQIAHLVDRADVEKLTSLSRSFGELKRLKPATIDGKPAAVYEGDLTDTAAFDLLQGPFEELVKRGTLAFRDVSGVGRIYLQGGFVRRVHLKAQGAYGYYDDDENTRRKGLCALEVVADLTKVGETEVAVPKEAALILEKPSGP